MYFCINSFSIYLRKVDKNLILLQEFNAERIILPFSEGYEELEEVTYFNNFSDQRYRARN